MAIDPAHLLEIHARMCAGDPTASADLIQAVYLPLARYALNRHGGFGLDIDQARDRALDVVSQLIKRPSQFDPAKGNLFGYLCMALDGDVVNHAQTAQARQKKFRDHVVEVRSVGGNSYETRPDVPIDARRIMKEHIDKLVKKPGDREVLELFLAEERETAAYAAVLGISHLPEDQRAAEVKKRKDTIEARLRRLKDKL